MINEKIMDMAKKCVGLALKKGARQAEVYIENGRNLDMTARDGAVETLAQSESMGMGLRLFIGNRLGFGYSSDFSADAVGPFVDRVIALGKVTAEDPFNNLPPVESLSPRSAQPETYDEAVAAVVPDWCAKTAIEMEKICKDFDPRIKTLEEVGAGAFVADVAIVNSTGLSDKMSSTYIWLYASPYAVGPDGKGQSDDYSDTKCFKGDLMSPEAVAKEAARRVTASLGAEKIPSGNMPVVFSPDMAKGFIRSIVGAVNGDMVFKKASFLADKLGQTIASSKITIVNDPALPRGVASTPFDGEGVPTRKLVIIDKGRLALFLYDAYTAAKAGVKSTASAVRGYSSLPGIGASNLYLEAGDASPEKIIGEVKSGFYVTKMMGRGANIITGDYSRGAQGFLIENGKLGRPVQEVTVAGSMLDMLKGIDAVGSDMDWRGSTGAPTIRFAELTVSGK